MIIDILTVLAVFALFYASYHLWYQERVFSVCAVALGLLLAISLAAVHLVVVDRELNPISAEVSPVRPAR